MSMGIVGLKIKVLREKVGMSQQELADKTHGAYKTGTAISLIESGARSVSDDNIQIFANIFGVEVQELFGPLKKRTSGILELNGKKYRIIEL